ncbi:hypothetical protein F8388_010598 [Cannabis sativa]|uniref:non-specific serine/threonine protein kinase n=1 Tax=Cannabis sativa TaxID=3483 RepID=A0A7J6GRM3_CANSA|nr:hypothetical protein F8388_010598 [Cannabis sativa]
MELSLKRHTSQISPTLPFSDTRVSGLAFDHSKFFKEIGAGDIGKAYTCKVLDSSTSYYYAMKVVNKKNLALKGNTLFVEFEDSYFSSSSLEVSSHVGIIYIDLKPKNTLIKSVSHIMLTDFDLSLYSYTIPSIRFYLCQVETLKAANWLFVVESVKIRSSSTVDTHKYISPEMAKDKSHGNKMD